MTKDSFVFDSSEQELVILTISTTIVLPEENIDHFYTDGDGCIVTMKCGKTFYVEGTLDRMRRFREQCKVERHRKLARAIAEASSKGSGNMWGAGK